MSRGWMIVIVLLIVAGGLGVCVLLAEDLEVRDEEGHVVGPSLIRVEWEVFGSGGRAGCSAYAKTGGHIRGSTTVDIPTVDGEWNPGEAVVSLDGPVADEVDGVTVDCVKPATP